MSQSKSTPKTIYLQDYTPPAFTITHIDLVVELGEDVTRVSSHLTFKRQTDASDHVHLDGEELDLQSVSINGNALTRSDYTISSTQLSFVAPADEFTADIVTLIKPQENTALEGLYKSSGNFCSQCEAEGFRKITYFLDRPDVMARFTTKVIGDGSKYPVMLSNGNLIESGHLEDGQQYNLWVDPYPKPAYLFALVAGDLGAVEDHFVTQSGRQVKLQIFVEKGNEDKCDHAMTSLKNSMKWDEEKYGREYDLDIFMIVAVSDFNMGAMENKGLNVFNSKYVLASVDTATDADYDGIESVIAHEYFHNWTGNRITCRDWFQLTLKEGLTVFRDQQFSADMNSTAVKRIEDVQRLRAAQFPEDAGPLSHPIQPQSYVEINNFYTATVYEKGAEVIRMAHTILGEDNFRKGTDLYFERHDGQAVTTEEFIAALEDASGIDLKQFRNWYTQPGTPEITVTDTYDETENTYHLHITQKNPKAGANALPLHIPMKIGLLGKDGNDLLPSLDGSGTELINLQKSTENITFHGIKEKPTPSLFRDFSAPIRLRESPADTDLAKLFRSDSDLFNRWESGQRLATQSLLELISDQNPQKLSDDYINAFGDLLQDQSLDPAYKAMAMSLPGEQFIGQQMSIVDVDAIHTARRGAIKTLSETFADQLNVAYNRHHPKDTTRDRSLKNTALLYLAGNDDAAILELARAQYFGATNMTDRISALSRLVVTTHDARAECLKDFYDRFENDSLVIDKWFTLQATSYRDTALEDVTELLSHSAFTYTNPNRVRSLIAAFASANPRHFHTRSGAGYQFLTDAIIKLNGINPQIAARLVSPLGQWRRFDEDRKIKMKSALKTILETPDITNDVYEMVSKSLGDD